MRAQIFPILFFITLALILVTPYVGVLIWAWVSMMNPHQVAGGWISTFPLNSVAVGLLVLSLVLHREPMLPPANSLMIIILVFMAWCVVTTALSLSPSISAARADLSFKNMIFGILVAATARNPVRFRALIWMFVLSYGFFGVKGGGFTLATGGAGNVVGPVSSTIEDRNQLALVLLMTIPLANYLRVTSGSRLARIGLLLVMVLSAFAVLGTYSRGGMIGLSFLAAYFWWTSPRKLTVAVCAVAVGLAALSALPDRWFDRMSTIESADQDESFEGRLDAWRFAMHAASERLTGVGFSATEDASVFRRYLPDASVTIGRGRAAHSIYFQVLGDHGFVGFALYLALFAAAWGSALKLSRANDEEVVWIAAFGNAVRVALATYFVVGAALSFAYDISIWCIYGLLCAAVRLRQAQAADGERSLDTSPSHLSASRRKRHPGRTGPAVAVQRHGPENVRAPTGLAARAGRNSHSK